MKVGDKVNVDIASVCYSAIGKIIDETPKFWKVKYCGHKTFDKLWDKQEPEIKLFHKHNNLQRGFYKELRFGDFLEITKI